MPAKAESRLGELIAGQETPDIRRARSWADLRMAALGELSEFHGKVTAQQLVRAHDSMSKELAVVDRERKSARQDVAKAYQVVQKALNGRRLRIGEPSPGGWYRYTVASLEAGRLRVLRDGLDAQSKEIQRQVGGLNETAILWMLDKVVGNRRQPLPMKLAVTRRVAALGESMLEHLGAELKATKDAPTLVAVIEGLRVLGTAARPQAARVVSMLNHDDPGVRERAALALAVIAVPEAIEPMIALLASERGMVRIRVAGALEVLTRQQLGNNVSSWRAWFEAERDAYTSGREPLGGGQVSATREQVRSYYFGIEQKGESILYIIDCSGSMEVDYENPEFDRGVGIPAKPGRSRLDACRRELNKALDLLTSLQRFNILWYNHEGHLYKASMQAASAKSIKAAKAFLRELKPDSGTNIYGALELAFQGLSRGGNDPAFAADFDMAYLLTDGMPTLPGAGPGNDLPENIVAAVRQWNPMGRVVIHTIGIGKNMDEGFLRRLAEQNGGTYTKAK